MVLRLVIGLAFIVVPMLELMLLIKIGQSIGVLATMAIVVATALTGIFIISRQSVGLVNRTLQAVSEGRPPVAPVMDGLFLLVAGVLLLTPGLVTDAAALALLVPPVRRAVARACVRWVLRRADIRIKTHGRQGGTGAGAEGSRSSASLGDGPIIEGEFERVERPGPHRNGRPGSNG